MSTATIATIPDITGQSWRARAACAGLDPRWWEPSDGHLTIADRERWAQAALTCADCPVQAECARDVVPADAGSVRAGRLVTITGGLRAIPAAPPPPRPRGRPQDGMPLPCGAKAAKRRHQRRGESCKTCRTGIYGRTPAGCGTRSAKRRHRDRGETCTACQAAAEQPAEAA